MRDKFVTKIAKNADSFNNFIPKWIDIAPRYIAPSMSQYQSYNRFSYFCS